MYKKIFIGLIIILSIMGTAGCEQQQYRNIEPESEKENIINTDVSDETVIDFSDREETVDSKSEDQGDMMSEIEYQYRFSEDRAWIKMLESSSYQGDFICVDSGGHVLFSVDSTEVAYVSPFKNGISFIETRDAVIQVDHDGNIINTYNLGDNVELKNYGEGQIWIQEYASDFNSAGYTYTLYDTDGESLTTFVVEGNDPIGDIFCYGKGVWGYDATNSNGESVQMFYCTQSNKWAEANVWGNHEIYFYDDIAILGINYEDPDETGYRAKMILMDVNGNVQEIGMTEDIGWNWGGPNYIKDGYCILEEYENYLVSYNVSTGTFTRFDNDYSSSIRMESLPDQMVFTDGSVVLPLTGQDEKKYVGIFDTSWNIIGEPIPCIRFDYSDGKLVVIQEVQTENGEGLQREICVYDSRGNMFFSSKEKDCRAITSYEDGIACMIDSSADAMTLSVAGNYSNLVLPEDFSGLASSLSPDWKYINENGDYLFDRLNPDGVKEVQLQQEY